VGTKKPSSSATNDKQELREQVIQRAYELYEARGREDGHDVEDWLQAEGEILQGKALFATA